MSSGNPHNQANGKATKNGSNYTIMDQLNK